MDEPVHTKPVSIQKLTEPRSRSRSCDVKTSQRMLPARLFQCCRRYPCTYMPALRSTTLSSLRAALAVSCLTPLRLSSTHERVMNSGDRSGAATAPTSRWPTQAYQPRHDTWPYAARDFARQDESSDSQFYAPPRFVTHIDDNAISTLREYYDEVLPNRGRILDLCSSWVSHFPKNLEQEASSTAQRKQDGQEKGDDQSLEVIGVGMNKAELANNPILSQYHLIDLNENPALPESLAPINAAVCVVSIDYLTQPQQVLTSLRSLIVPGGSVHLIISNRCFPTKAVGRWLRVSEDERLKMVGDYLHFSGWKEIEIVTLVEPPMGMRWMSGNTDPLWVVRGKRVD